MLIDREQELEELKGGAEWTINYVFFARNSFTEAAQAEAKIANATLVDLPLLDQGLQRR